MRIFQLPVLTILLAFITGILISFYFKLNFNFLSICLIFNLLIVILYYYFKLKIKFSGVVFSYLLLSLFVLLGGLTYKNHLEIDQKNHFSNFLLDKENQLKAIITEKLKSSNYYDKYLLQTKIINTKPAQGKIILYLPKKLNYLAEIGNEIQLYSNINLLENPSNIIGFNYVNYLQNQQIYYEIKGNENTKIIVQKSSNWYGFINKIKVKLLSGLTKNYFTQGNYQLLAALLFGEKNNLSTETTKDYTEAGVVHVLAISGMHISLFYFIILALCSPLKKLKNQQVYIFCISIGLLWFYAALTGFSASITRAVVMFSIIAVGNLLQKDKNTLHSVVVSALFLLVYNPFYIFDIGFQLSYMAVFAIVLGNPILKPFVYSKYWIVKNTKELLGVSFVAQLGVLPLTLYYFGQFPLLFLVANLVVIFISNIVLVGGLVYVFVNCFVQFKTNYLAVFLDFLINCMNSFTKYICSFNQLIIKNISFHWMLVLALYVVLFLFYKWAEKPKTKPLKLVLISIIGFYLVYIYLIFNAKQNSEFVVFNQFKNTVMVKNTDNNCVFYTDNFEASKSKIDAYCKANFIKNKQVTNLRNTYFYQQKILLIDSSSVYVPNQKVSVVVLTQSAKVNLSRLINTVKPTTIVADGSNYKSYINLWQNTCQKANISFYNTNKKGEFYIK